MRAFRVFRPAVVRIGLALCLMAAGVGTASAQSVRILGRAASDKEGGFTLAWPASGFETVFTGSRLTATVEDSGKNWYDVEVDGKTSRLALKPGRNAYTLVDAPKGAHRVRFTRRTNGLSGATRVVAVKADGPMQAPAAPSRLLLAIGDSIVSGYGVEGPNQSCHFTPDTENANLAYAALAARALGADLQAVALDGHGLYRNAGGASDPTMAELSWRTLPDAPARWPANSPAPQAIVVNLGVNDFYPGDPGPGFGKAYVAFLRDLRTTYSDAWIFAAFGAMLDGAKYDAARKAVSDAAKARAAAGDRRVAFIEFRPPDGPNRYGCDWHPGRGAQADMARTLQRAILRTGVWSH